MSKMITDEQWKKILAFMEWDKGEWWDRILYSDAYEVATSGDGFKAIIDRLMKQGCILHMWEAVNSLDVDENEICSFHIIDAEPDNPRKEGTGPDNTKALLDALLKYLENMEV